ncbi:hypothetical protein LSAT2_012764 [Lamellibrachia satsuma]|nr:hypothetical protein LSAT2_012764 [Lamellibrachia satsuma]
MKGYLIVIFLTTAMLTKLCFSATEKTGISARTLYRRCLKVCNRAFTVCMKTCQHHPNRPGFTVLNEELPRINCVRRDGPDNADPRRCHRLAATGGGGGDRGGIGGCHQHKHHPSPPLGRLTDVLAANNQSSLIKKPKLVVQTRRRVQPYRFVVIDVYSRQLSIRASSTDAVVPGSTGATYWFCKQSAQTPDTEADRRLYLHQTVCDVGPLTYTELQLSPQHPQTVE